MRAGRYCRLQYHVVLRVADEWSPKKVDLVLTGDINEPIEKIRNLGGRQMREETWTTDNVLILEHERDCYGRSQDAGTHPTR